MRAETEVRKKKEKKNVQDETRRGTSGKGRDEESGSRGRACEQKINS